MNLDQLEIKNFDYILPTQCIAEFPLAERHQSKLLVYKNGQLSDNLFFNIADHLPPTATLIINNTKVMEARIFFQKLTGAFVEIFCLEPHRPATIREIMTQTGQCQWRCLIGGASKWKPGQMLQKQVQVSHHPVLLTATYIQKNKDHFIIEFSWDTHDVFADILHAAGTVPLPPYIKREVEEEDKNRYQTIFAQHQGSVAAPTAALHFTENVFQQLAAKQIIPYPITLHVSAGTFKPVKADLISEHTMHAETFSVSTDTLKSLLDSNTIIAVGTTSLRTLESLYWLGIKLIHNKETDDFTLNQWEAYELEDSDISYRESIEVLYNYLQKQNQTELVCRTSLLIVPGYSFRSASILITNFHQPKSTLLLLVAAFIGEDWKKVYAHALENNYRFLSYGDSSLLWRSKI